MQGVTAAFLKSRHGIYLEHPLKTRTYSMEISMTDFFSQYLVEKGVGRGGTVDMERRQFIEYAGCHSCVSEVQAWNISRTPFENQN